MKIAFLGLGPMGLPMATRLVTAGHDVSTGTAVRAARRARTARGGHRGRGGRRHEALHARGGRGGRACGRPRTRGLTGAGDVLEVFGTVVPFPDAQSAAAAKLVVNTALAAKDLSLLGDRAGPLRPRRSPV